MLLGQLKMNLGDLKRSASALNETLLDRACIEYLFAILPTQFRQLLYLKKIYSLQ